MSDSAVPVEALGNSYFLSRSVDGGFEEVWLSVRSCAMSAFYLLLELLYLLLELLNQCLLMQDDADELQGATTASGFRVPNLSAGMHHSYS